MTVQIVSTSMDLEISSGANVRGVALGVGVPSANISFFVNAGRNESYIYGPNGLCDKVFSKAGCFTYRGGEYDHSKSSTSSKVDYRDNKDGTSADWFKDDLYAEPNMTLHGITFGVPTKDLDQQYKPQAQLGVGKNSSLLNSLKGGRKIGARAYSIFWGLASGPAAQRTTGSLLLGGIDEALTGVGTKKFTSSLTYDFTCSTGMLVAINDISLNWPIGTDTSIFSGQRSTAMKACLQPDYPGLMTLPAQYWKNFVQLAGGNYPGGVESRALGFNFWTTLFEPEGVFYGDLTFSLQNTISIRIPNTQVVVPDTYVDVSTGQVRTNDTVQNVPINPIQDINKNDLLILGRLFFTSAYLSVNHDTETFSIWQAMKNPGDPKPKAITANNTVTGDFCSVDNEQPALPSSTPVSSSVPEPQQKAITRKLSGPAVGGIVAESVAAIALLAATIFVISRKRTQRKALETGESMDQPDQPPALPYYDQPNMPAIASEMPVTSKYATELAAYTIPAEAQELDSREQNP